MYVLPPVSVVGGPRFQGKYFLVRDIVRVEIIQLEDFDFPLDLR